MWSTEPAQRAGYYKNKYTSLTDVRSKILSKLINVQALCDTPIDCANNGLCVLIEDISRRLPLQLKQCSYQG